MKPRTSFIKDRSKNGTRTKLVCFAFSVLALNKGIYRQLPIKFSIDSKYEKVRNIVKYGTEYLDTRKKLGRRVKY